MNKITTNSDKLFANTRRKIIVVVTAIVMLVMLLFSGIVMFAYNIVMFRAVDMELEQYKTREKTMLSNFFDQSAPPKFDYPSATPQQENGILDDYAGENGTRYVRFLFIDGRVVWSSSEGYSPTSDYPELSEMKENDVVRFDFGGQKFRGILVKKNNMAIIAAINVTSEYESISKIVLALLIGLAAMFVVVLFVARYYSKRIVSPLKEAYIKQAFFIQDASHEMRTPLSVIRGKIELVAQHPNDEIQEHSYEFSDIISEITSMEKMNSSLLMLSKQDAFINREISTFRLYDMINELSDELFSMLAELQNKKFSFSVLPQDVVVSWDYARMKQALTILLDNAFKYTDEGDVINITATQSKDGTIVVNVYDSGRGIKSADLSRIFDRFYRSDDVRAQDISGSGIGLSLLSLLGNNLGFKIKVSSEYAVFTEFTITAPCIMK